MLPVDFCMVISVGGCRLQLPGLFSSLLWSSLPSTFYSCFFMLITAHLIFIVILTI